MGTSGDLGSGDLSHDIVESWTEMKEENTRLERQTKVKLRSIIHFQQLIEPYCESSCTVAKLGVQCKDNVFLLMYY